MPDRDEEHVLILAPRGRDAKVAAQVLQSSGTTCIQCADAAELRTEYLRGADAALVTEEALAEADLAAFLDDLDHQPPWSDFPFIVLATKRVGARPPAASQLLNKLGNVILLERPINAETLTSAVASASRARRRQYEARRHLLQREQAREQLRTINETLEQLVSDRTDELDSARETLAFALDAAGMGSWDLDLLTDMSRRSLRHDRIFGYEQPVASWGQADFIAHIHPDDRDLATTALADAAIGGSLSLTCRIIRIDQETRWIDVKGRAQYSEDGTPVRMAGILIDTTDQQRTEDALRQAQKMEAIGQLTGGVAHDFNNLLTVIIGGLDMLIRRPEKTDRVLRLAEAAMTAARRGEQLTQQLLAFSRKGLLRPETLNPNRLLINFETLAKRAAGESIQLTLDLDPGVDPIRIDAAQFESAVLNLIVNARDAMPIGGNIHLRSQNLRLDSKFVSGKDIAPGDYVMIAVQDEGSGMDAATLSHVFEPFFTTKEVGKGSGLGLSQVYGFVRSAGGYVLVDSATDIGTTVKLFFPKSTDAASEEQQLLLSKVPLRSATKGETVLLVEDDEQVLEMAIESLEDLRYIVIVARNAREALTHLEGDDRIDLMFSDVVMPGGMNGAQLAVEARRLRPELKILLTSGYVVAQAEIIDSDLPVLTKPYKRDELAQQLRLVLGSS